MLARIKDLSSCLPLSRLTRRSSRTLPRLLDSLLRSSWPNTFHSFVSLMFPNLVSGTCSAVSFAAPSRSPMPAADARPVPARDQSPPRKSILAIFWDPANPAFCPDIQGQSVSLSMPYPCALESAGISTPSGSPICCIQKLPCAAGSRPLVGSCEYCHSL